MPKELEENLKKLPWPPTIKLGEEEEEIHLTELDVNWMFCTLLGMTWASACDVTDEMHRKFLYNKAMEVAANSQGNKSQLEAEKERLEAKIDKQIENIQKSIEPRGL